ncbi:alanine racemase [candidate division KSB1 bacterium]|nr:alanine racemase [candidate division KSB1 bacterium]
MSNFNRRNFFQLSGAAAAGLAVSGYEAVASIPTNQPKNPTDPWLEIDLKNMGWNLNQIRKKVNNRPVMAVIKANAYGHGLVKVGKYLESQSVAFLAVGKFQEALSLRENEVKTPILNFGSFSNHEAEEMVRNNISQSIYTDDFKLLSAAARKQNKTAKVHIKMDTGLGRIGVPYYKALHFIEKVAVSDGIKIEGIFTPLTEDEEFDKAQLQRFLEVCESAKKKGIPLGLRHMASSAGVISSPETYLDMVRPGIAIYGQYPSTREYKARNIDLRPVMTLKTRVMYVKTLRPGDSVSYHKAFLAIEDTPVATLSIGYSDGYPNQAAGKAEVLLHGKRWPSVALVTSNHMTINISGSKDIKIGDEVVLFGKQGDNKIAAEELAAWAGTSVYKILIWMNPLLPREFL